MKSYQRHSSLQKHLECGRHKYVLEYETLYDRTVLEHASRLEKGPGAVLELRDTESTPSSSVAALEMGWALKQSRSRNIRFTDKQKDYLIAKFQTGEQMGQKVDTASVSRLIRSEKDENGEQLLDYSEFLTRRQISACLMVPAAVASCEFFGVQSC